MTFMRRALLFASMGFFALGGLAITLAVTMFSVNELSPVWDRVATICFRAWWAPIVIGVILLYYIAPSDKPKSRGSGPSEKDKTP